MGEVHGNKNQIGDVHCENTTLISLGTWTLSIGSKEGFCSRNKQTHLYLLLMARKVWGRDWSWCGNVVCLPWSSLSSFRGGGGGQPLVPPTNHLHTHTHTHTHTIRKQCPQHLSANGSANMPANMPANLKHACA